MFHIQMFTSSKKIATKINSMSQVECPQQKKTNNNKIPPAQMITREKIKLNSGYNTSHYSSLLKPFF